MAFIPGYGRIPKIISTEELDLQTTIYTEIHCVLTKLKQSLPKKPYSSDKFIKAERELGAAFNGYYDEWQNWRDKNQYKAHIFNENKFKYLKDLAREVVELIGDVRWSVAERNEAKIDDAAEREELYLKHPPQADLPKEDYLRDAVNRLLQ